MLTCSCGVYCETTDDWNRHKEWHACNPDPRDRELSSLRETEKAFHDLRNEHAEWQVERANLRERVAELEEEITLTRLNCVRAERERDQAQARVKALEGLLCNAEQTLDAARKEIQRLDNLRRLAAGRREGVIGVHERLLEEARAECARLKEALEGDNLTGKRVYRLLEERDRYREALEYCACEGEDSASIHAMDQFYLAEAVISMMNCASHALRGEEERKG